MWLRSLVLSSPSLTCPYRASTTTPSLLFSLMLSAIRFTSVELPGALGPYSNSEHDMKKPQRRYSSLHLQETRRDEHTGQKAAGVSIGPPCCPGSGTFSFLTRSSSRCRDFSKPRYGSPDKSPGI